MIPKLRTNFGNRPASLRLLLISATIFFLEASLPALAAEPLLLVGKETVDATFHSSTAQGELQFKVKGKPLPLRLQEMVRWSTQSPTAEQSEIVLIDGSRLVLAESWVGRPNWQLAENSISVTTKLFGEIELQRNRVRAILLHAPKGRQQRLRFLDQLLDETEKLDRFYLTNGDQWQGDVVRLEKNQEGSRRIHCLLGPGGDPLQIPESRVAAILFGHQDTLSKQQKELVVGLSDGSLLVTESLVTDAEQLRIRLAGGTSLIGTDQRDITYLRSLTASCVYLSDLLPSNYQHNPYLEIPWPYRRDRNILNGPLVVAGRSYAKGLGMPTSARLTYRLGSKQRTRFVASVAVDDIAGGRGSVVFCVYFHHDGDWQEAFVSPVVRGGDPPVAVSVELGDAKQLALVTKFADRGDECDYANWLEARLE